MGQFGKNPTPLLKKKACNFSKTGTEWCPRASSAMSDFFGLGTRIFYSHLRVIDVHRRKHPDCTNLQCLTCQVDKAKYKPVHLKTGCGCDFVGVDPSPLLRQGCMPLVHLVDRQDELLAVELIEKTAATRYVAISHVWSDGLGNPIANAMPACQLREIWTLVQNLYPGSNEPVPFWIDILCVPAATGSTKKEAIKKTRDIYTLANKVLVLDSALRNLSVSGRSVLYQAMYIFSSNWMSRLWTLQEGTLCQALWVRFADATLECARIKEEAIGFYLSLQRGWGNWLDIQTMYSYICGSEKISKFASGGKTFDISNICKSLSRRCTSVVEDEALCLGSLLALDMDRIAGAQPADRMRGFWSTIQSVPESLVFWRYGTMQEKGFRWAPRTLLGTGSTWLDAGSVRGRPQAIPTPAGLFVEAYAIELTNLASPLLNSIDDLFWIRSRDGSWEYFGSKFEASCLLQNYRPFSVPKESFDRIVLLTTDHISDEKGLFLTHMVMVFVYREEKGVTYARRGDSGCIYKVAHPGFAGGLKQRMMRKRDSMVSTEAATSSPEIGNCLLDNMYGAIVGDWSFEKQTWCID